LSWQVFPKINADDTVAAEGIKLGDNDNMDNLALID
jgi:glutamate 5-kinase